MRRRRIRTAYAIRTARCTVCRPGQSAFGADHMATAAVAIDFRVVFAPNICRFVKYSYESGFYQY